MKLKGAFLYLLLFGFCWQSHAQKQYLRIESQFETEQKIIDSIGFLIDHPNAKSVLEESKLFGEKLSKNGFLESNLEDQKKINDSTFLFQFKLGKKTSFIHIYVGGNSEVKKLALLDTKNDTLVLPYRDVDSFLKQTLSKLEKKGFALSKIQFNPIEKKDDYLIAQLNITLEKKRTLDGIVIQGYTKFPESHKNNLNRIYKKRTFNQDNLKNIYADIDKFRFVKQIKYPEILFTNDSTKIYAYLEKVQSNTFEGFIGFTNNDSKKLVVNGYIDLSLINLMNSGEKIAIYWKSDGNDQKTFNASFELPYVFKTPFGLKAQLNIFKQDSTFQNTKTALDVGYFFNYSTRLYLGYQSTESSDIQNLNTISISDYSNTFVTSQFEFTDFKSDDFLFPEKTKIDFKMGVGSRKSKINANNQYFLALNGKHIFYLNEKNNIQIKSQNYYLNSNSYIVNELYRFGGINSIRGFNENSLQAHLFSSILSEYRYVVAPNLYVHSIIDYGYFNDKTSNRSGNLIGLGIGFGLVTKNGLFNIVYANGSSKEQAIKGSNSVVHISFKTQF